MARPPAWDIYEAAILLDAYLQYERGERRRAEVIQTVSSSLRARAIARGVSIDDLYRNTNGISCMLGSMQYLMTDGKTGLPRVSKVFQTVVSLYRTNPEEYAHVLEKAMQFDCVESPSHDARRENDTAARDKTKTIGCDSLPSSWERGREGCTVAKGGTYSEHGKSSTGEKPSILLGVSSDSSLPHALYVNSFAGFAKWLIDQGKPDKEARDFAFRIAMIGSYARERGIENPDLYGCEDLGKLCQLVGQLHRCGEIQQGDKENGMRLSKALEYFVGFASALYGKQIDGAASVDNSLSAPKDPREIDTTTSDSSVPNTLVSDGTAAHVENEHDADSEAVNQDALVGDLGEEHSTAILCQGEQVVHEAVGKPSELQEKTEQKQSLKDAEDGETDEHNVIAYVEPSDGGEQPPIVIDDAEKAIPQAVMDLELENLIGGHQAAPFYDYEIYTVFDLTLYYREELLELPKITNGLLISIERKISERWGMSFVIQGDSCNAVEKRSLTNTEMDALDQPLSSIGPALIRQLRQRAIHSWRRVAFNTLEELLDCPGIDLETVFLLEEHVGKMLGYRLYLGRRRGEIPLVAPAENPLMRRLAPADARISPATDDVSIKLRTPCLMDWISTLTGSMGMVTRAFLTEDDEYSIASNGGISLDAAWGILARVMMRKPELREDSYASQFSDYGFSPRAFCSVTGEPLTTYRYLKLICIPGRSAPQKMVDDKASPTAHRKRVSGRLGTGGVTITASRLTIDRSPSRRFGATRVRPAARPACMGIMHMSNREIVSAIDELVVDGNEYTTLHLFKRLPDRMRQCIESVQVFEELLSWVYRSDSEVSLPSPGVIRFGRCSRKRQVLGLCASLGTDDSNTISRAYKTRYGMHADVVRWWLYQLEGDSAWKRMRRATSGYRKAASISIDEQQLEFLRSELNGDCCDRILVLERFRARFPHGPENPLNERVLQKMGYERHGKKLLMRRGIDPLSYFDALIVSRPRFSRGDSAFENAVFNDPMFRKALRCRARMYDVVEYEKDSFISLGKLCETMQVDTEAVTGYSQDIARAVGRAVPFTIWSLRNHDIVTHPLDVLATEGGVSDYLFESLLDIDPHVQTCSLGRKRCFIVADGPITAGNFLECVLELNGQMTFDDLQFLLRDDYGIEIAELPLHNTIRQSSLYYDDLTDSVYNSRSEWEEMVENELA